MWHLWCDKNCVLHRWVSFSKDTRSFIQPQLAEIFVVADKIGQIALDYDIHMHHMVSYIIIVP